MGNDRNLRRRVSAALVDLGYKRDGRTHLRPLQPGVSFIVDTGPLGRAPTSARGSSCATIRSKRRIRDSSGYRMIRSSARSGPTSDTSSTARTGAGNRSETERWLAEAERLECRVEDGVCEQFRRFKANLLADARSKGS